MTLPKSVAIGMPCYGGLIHARTAKSVMLATQALDAHGVHVEHIYLEHESLVQRGRNLIAHLFLKGSCERLVFVDADIVFQPDGMLALLEREEDVVGACYPRKALNWQAIKAAVARGEEHPQRFAADFVVNVVRPEGVSEVIAPVRDGCLLEVEALATGFLSLSREGLLRMAEAYPETIYKSDDRQHAHEAMHALFDCGIVGERYLSEDYFFCHRWRAMGGQCWLHLGIALGHIGVHTYAGDLTAMFQPVAA
jgi:hypothetical protein